MQEVPMSSNAVHQLHSEHSVVVKPPLSFCLLWAYFLVFSCVQALSRVAETVGTNSMGASGESKMRLVQVSPATPWSQKASEPSVGHEADDLVLLTATQHINDATQQKFGLPSAVAPHGLYLRHSGLEYEHGHRVKEDFLQPPILTDHLDSTGNAEAVTTHWRHKLKQLSQATEIDKGTLLSSSKVTPSLHHVISVLRQVGCRL
jgi:hypothetical protein